MHLQFYTKKFKKKIKIFTNKFKNFFIKILRDIVQGQDAKDLWIVNLRQTRFFVQPNGFLNISDFNHVQITVAFNCLPISGPNFKFIRTNTTPTV